MSGRRTVKSASRIFGPDTGVSRHIAAQSLIGPPAQIAVGVLLVAVAGCVDTSVDFLML
jgi:hypothetical protein